jgi:hypothetical protein
MGEIGVSETGVVEGDGSMHTEVYVHVDRMWEHFGSKLDWGTFQLYCNARE